MRIYAAVLATYLFALATLAGDIALNHASRQIASAQAYLNTNSVAWVYDTNMPIRIYTPAGHPELLIGFPLVEQNAIVKSNGWVEIGIKFDCSIILPDTFQVTKYPDENGNRLMMRFSTNEHSRSCLYVTNYNQLVEQKAPNKQMHDICR